MRLVACERFGGTSPYPDGGTFPMFLMEKMLMRFIRWRERRILLWWKKHWRLN